MPSRVLLAGQPLVRLKRYRESAQNVNLGEYAGARDEVEFAPFVIDARIDENIGGERKRGVTVPGDPDYL
jgi:hypothetical protein